MTKDPIAVRIGKAIRARRRSLGLSQEAFAQSIEMYPAYFGKIERGEYCPNVATLQRIAAGLSARMSDLMLDAGL